jgi:hypothetical protein
LVFLLAVSFSFDPAAHAIHHRIVDTFGLPMVMDGEMALPRYAALMIIRIVLDFLLVMSVHATPGRRLEGVPPIGPSPMRFVLVGLATRAWSCCGNWFRLGLRWRGFAGRLLGFCDRGSAAGHTQAQRWP